MRCNHLRKAAEVEGEKASPNFFFQCIHPDAIAPGSFACARTRDENIAAVVQDVLGPGSGNTNARLPGRGKHEAALRSEKAGGLLFSDAEVAEWSAHAEGLGVEWDAESFGAFDG